MLPRTSNKLTQMHKKKKKKGKSFTSKHGFQYQRHKGHFFLDCMQDPTKGKIHVNFKLHPRTNTSKKGTRLEYVLEDG